MSRTMLPNVPRRPFALLCTAALGLALAGCGGGADAAASAAGSVPAPDPDAIVGRNVEIADEEQGITGRAVGIELGPGNYLPVDRVSRTTVPGSNMFEAISITAPMVRSGDTAAAMSSTDMPLRAA